MAEKKLRLPYLPARYNDSEVAAIKALVRGDADAEQQRLAIEWILRDACGLLEFHFYATDRDTAFALGRAFVGQQINKLINFDPALMRRGNPRPEEV